MIVAVDRLKMPTTRATRDRMDRTANTTNQMMDRSAHKTARPRDGDVSLSNRNSHAVLAKDTPPMAMTNKTGWGYSSEIGVNL